MATNAGGMRVLRYGDTRAQLLGLTAVLGTGHVVSHMGGLIKDNTGYFLPGILCGSEGTLGLVTAARLRLVPRAPERVVALLERVLERNGLVEDDIISILFTATEDVVSTFPATAARSMGLGAVPLICARELAITGSVPRCIRVMLHVTTERPREEIHHVYLEGAQGLRDDLPD